MLPFFHSFPDIAAKEVRTARVQGASNLPDGEYGFLESYCSDPRCDCRRVLINVFRSDTGNKIWATINFGWESTAFYRKWLHDVQDADAMKGQTLDRINLQTEYAPALLVLFTAIIQDNVYAERLEKHYNLVKSTQAPSVPLPSPKRQHSTQKVKRGRRR